MSVFRVEGYIYDDFQKDSFSNKVEYAYLFVSLPAVSKNIGLSEGLRTFTYKVEASLASEIFSSIAKNDFVELYFSSNSENAKVSFVKKVDFDSLDEDFKLSFLQAVESDLEFLNKYN